MERLQVEDLWLILVQRIGDGTAPPAVLWIQCQHPGYRLVEIVTILLLEQFQQNPQSVLPELVRRDVVDTIAILKGAAGEDGQADAEDLGQAGVGVGRVDSPLYELVIDLLRGKEHLHSFGVEVLDGRVIIAQFPWQRHSAYNLDLAGLVDENVPGMHTSDLALQLFELGPRPHHVVQQIPHLSLQEVLLYTVTVQHLRLQHELVIVETHLPTPTPTFTNPRDPHSPADSNECFSGSSSTSRLYESVIWLSPFAQLW